MSNRETRVRKEYLHLYLALDRTGTNKDHRCIRTVIKNEEEDLAFLESKLKVLGGEWRIHRTVNARDPQQALKNLMHKMIDHPECASTIDSEWRTALLQSNCIYGDKKFLLDIDTKDENKIKKVKEEINIATNFQKWNTIKQIIETPKGWHYITIPFDTRKVCQLEDVSLIRDGYMFIKLIK